MWVLFLQLAHGWETDQLTGRGAPLADSTEAADEEMNRLIAEALQRVRSRLRCDAPQARVHRVTARWIQRLTSRNRAVAGRGAIRRLGYGVYSAWLETSPQVARIAFPEREDVFGGVPFHVAPLLSMAGTCSTVSLAGVRMGTDKPDHFLETGYRCWKRSRRDPQRGPRWGTMTERTWFGWWTSSGFSRSDLVANLAGQRFYATLFDPDDGLLTQDDQGCVTQARPFSWTDHVDIRWDELHHPTTYRPAVVRWLDDRLDAEAEQVCEGWDDWGPPIQASIEAFLTGRDGPEVVGRAKARQDAWDLARRCEGRGSGAP